MYLIVRIDKRVVNLALSHGAIYVSKHWGSARNRAISCRGIKSMNVDRDCIFRLHWPSPAQIGHLKQ